MLQMTMSLLEMPSDENNNLHSSLDNAINFGYIKFN